MSLRLVETSGPGGKRSVGRSTSPNVTWALSVAAALMAVAMVAGAVTAPSCNAVSSTYAVRPAETHGQLSYCIAVPRYGAAAPRHAGDFVVPANAECSLDKAQLAKKAVELTARSEADSTACFKSRDPLHRILSWFGRD